MMTTLTRWEPFGMELPTWIERVLEERPLAAFDNLLNRSAMRIEEFMDNDTLVVRVEIPDVDIDKDVDISVHDGLLHIKAQRSESTERQDKAFFRSEFRYGAFERTLPLPPGATVDDVKATYQNGVVQIRIPTSQTSESATKVPVQRVG